MLELDRNITKTISQEKTETCSDKNNIKIVGINFDKVNCVFKLKWKNARILYRAVSTPCVSTRARFHVQCVDHQATLLVNNSDL